MQHNTFARASLRIKQHYWRNEMPQTSEYAQTSTRSWTTRRDEKRRRMQLVQPWMKGPILSKEKIVDALQWHSYTPFGSFNTCSKSYPLPITSHKPTYRY